MPERIVVTPRRVTAELDGLVERLAAANSLADVRAAAERGKAKPRARP